MSYGFIGGTFADNGGGGALSTSSNTSSSESTSTPTAIQTPENQLEMQIAQTAASLGQQIFNWAQGVFAKTSQITDQMVNSFIAVSQQGMQLAAAQLDQYKNVTLPEMNQFAQMAGQYTSQPRTQYNMGAAEATAGQAGEAALQNTLQNLRAFGVDPSSGMYGDILAAQRTGIGAAEAGAGQQAQINTQNVGRQLLEQSIQSGQQLPGDVVNALNSAYQGVAGAENSVLSNANVGATLQSASAPFLNAAMQLKNPPVGQNSQSVSQSKGASVGGGGGGSKGGGRSPSSGRYGGYGGPPTGGTVGRFGPLTQPGLATNLNAGQGPVIDANGAMFPDQNSGNGFDPNAWNQAFNADVAAGNMGAPNEGAIQPLDVTPSGFSQSGFDQAFGAAMQGPTATSTNEGAILPDQSPFGPWSQDSGFSNDVAGQFQGPMSPLDMGGGAPGTTPGGYAAGGDNVPDATSGGGGGYSAPPVTDQTAPGGGYNAGPTVANTAGDYFAGGGGYAGGGGGYARGGVIPGANRGGLRAVPRTASPSMGARTDDVHARSNAGEFVIPKDVAAWKGHEFFQKLIDGSRKARLMGSAQGKPASPPKGPVQFSTAGGP